MVSRAANSNEPSAVHQLRVLRHDLVAELVLRRGLFWDAVSTLRANWGVAPTMQLPPRDPAGYLPPRALEPLPPDPLAAALKAFALGRVVVPGDRVDDLDHGAPPRPGFVPFDGHPALPAWKLDIDDLHDGVVPEAYRFDVDVSRTVRRRFLSACVLYDPPREAVIRFADLNDPLEVKIAPGSDGTGATTLLELARLIDTPVRFVADEADVEDAVARFYEDLLDVLHGRLAPIGIDLRGMVRHVRRTTALEPVLAERKERLERRSYVLVTDSTTKRDVELAWKTLSAKHRPGPKARDRLLAIQCAIWKDEFRLTERDIALRLGRELRPDDYGARRRSYAVRDHIKLGRGILAEAERTTTAPDPEPPESELLPADASIFEEIGFSESPGKAKPNREARLRQCALADAMNVQPERLAELFGWPLQQARACLEEGRARFGGGIIPPE